MDKIVFQPLTDMAFWRKRKEEIRKRFLSVTQIASSVNWNVHYAFFKPVTPTEEELKRFQQKVRDVKEELLLLKKHFKPKHPQMVQALESKLNHLIEEYKSYPFSNREEFFQIRLNFLRNALKKCFVG
ncbi:MAG TPA: hypothetical protein EYH48_02605 [Aquifex aeolicus]|uniref:Uncharacterized protein n=1 Tax=Aquifex aeolicus TaxID=63363 RepID=A0A9D0YNN8_AQUAO|nr:hypothetical protein [Aquificales bacterium]HIP86715.1 hypothetical protein [Aquifex sp.]HIP97861.1 hypothetical protein [Aquifex aeolicus]HIQ26209.1 hypothetical protein [Aquifex aeolicus]